MKLAICEDNPVHYNMIHTLLKKYLKDSFEVTHFTSGDEFLRVVEGEGCPYSIVLTDIDLGSDDLNGISLADKINQPQHQRNLLLPIHSPRPSKQFCL